MGTAGFENDWPEIETSASFLNGVALWPPGNRGQPTEPVLCNRVHSAGPVSSRGYGFRTEGERGRLPSPRRDSTSASDGKFLRDPHQHDCTAPLGPTASDLASTE